MNLPTRDLPARPQLSRRSMLGLLAGGLAAGPLAACAGPGSTATGKPEAPRTDGKIEGKVSFAHWRAEDSAAFDALIASFVAAHPGVQVAQDIAPSNDFQSQALNRLRGGSVGDVFPTFRGAQFEQFVKAGVYTELTGSPTVAKYEKGLIGAGASGGKQYGLPYQIVFGVPIGNLDLLSKAGVGEAPKDWDGFLNLLDKLKGNGVVPIAWPGGDTGNAGQLFNSMVMNNAPADDTCAAIETGGAKLTDPWFLQTLRQYQQLIPFLQPNSTGTANEPAQQLFATGRAAILATGSYHIAAVRKLGAAFDIDLVTPITTSADAARYETTHNATFILGVNSASKVQPAAAAWLDHLSDPINAGKYADATAQHVSVAGVEYTNADLKRLAPHLQQKSMLAVRFQFLDLDIRNAAEGAAVEVVGGAAPEQAAEKAQAIIDQRL